MNNGCQGAQRSQRMLNDGKSLRFFAVNYAGFCVF